MFSSSKDHEIFTALICSRQQLRLKMHLATRQNCRNKLVEFQREGGAFPLSLYNKHANMKLLQTHNSSRIFSYR